MFLSGRATLLHATVVVTIFGAAAVGRAGDLESAPPSISIEELGRLLFWDPILSGERDVACATCHHPDFAYADGRELSLGPGAVGLGPARVDRSGGLIPPVRRNAQTVLNTTFNGLDRRRGRRGGDDVDRTPDSARAPMFWDSRVRSLEAQALEPIKVFEEMRGSAYDEEVAVDSVVARLRSIPEYVEHFATAFGEPSSVDAEHLAAALAAFQRSLVAMDSPFDRFRAGDRTAMTAEQIRGMEVFDNVGCDRCHDGPMFSDFDHHAEGVAEHPMVSEPDEGRGRFQFRTPSLRNVGLTAPYMHNGTLATLEDVLSFYDAGRSENPNVADRGRRRGGDRGGVSLSGDFRRVDDMTGEEMRQIVAFLHALTDEGFDRHIPDRVPSGLPPGGRIDAPDTIRP
ncbi:MAG: cytochrome c peroxidase [Gemmatimonadota bacterium]|nr:cytochrome c peroxidase [Gemmatimonadota bacterium]